MKTYILNSTLGKCQFEFIISWDVTTQFFFFSYFFFWNVVNTLEKTRRRRIIRVKWHEKLDLTLSFKAPIFNMNNMNYLKAFVMDGRHARFWQPSAAMFSNITFKKARWRVSKRKACQQFFERFESLGINQLCKFKCIFLKWLHFTWHILVKMTKVNFRNVVGGYNF